MLFIILIVLYYAIKNGQASLSGIESSFPPAPYYPYAGYQRERLRRKVLGFPKILYGSLILVGFLLLFLGIILVDVSRSAPLIATGAIESIIGLVIIFVSFKIYKIKMRKMGETILPEVLSSEK